MSIQVFTYKIRKLPKIVYRKLGKEQSWGTFDGKNTIEIDDRLKGKRLLEIKIHEFIHWQSPELSEEEVVIKSRELTEFLWRNNYRKIDQEP